MPNIFKNLWFRDPNEVDVCINDVAVRIRAGMLLIIPLYMGLTLYDVLYTSSWVVDSNTAVDTYDTDWDDRIIYAVEATKRTYEYSTQTIVLFYALFEMIVGMFVFSSRFSPTILISTFLARNSSPDWKRLSPKRFAWTIGSTLIIACLLYFNPDTFAAWINTLTGNELLPTTENYMPNWVPNLIWVCLAFMWLEAILGLCVGCKCHTFLVWIGVFKGECKACNDIDWDAIKKRKEAKNK